MKIEWWPLLIAVAIALVAGMILGAAWGIIAYFLIVASEDTAEAFYGSQLGAVTGFIVGLIPVIAGVVYLLDTIDGRKYEHCTIFGGLHILVSLMFVPFIADPMAWTDIAHWLAVIPTALATCWVIERM